VAFRIDGSCGDSHDVRCDSNRVEAAGTGRLRVEEPGPARGDHGLEAGVDAECRDEPVDSHDGGAAIAIARSVLLSHLYEHGPEFRRVGIHYTDAMPVS
jgi:hypothetical protein